MNNQTQLKQTEDNHRDTTMKTIRHWIGLAATAGIIATQALIGVASADNKAIYVVGTPTQSALEFSFRPTASAFRAGKPITFNMRANQRVFLYVYARNTDGSSTLILPNYLQTQNQYNPNQTTPVPNRGVHFVADGVSNFETVYAVASTRYIDLDLAAQRRVGQFPVMSHRAMARKFAEKGINIVDAHSHHPTQTVAQQSAVRRVDISILPSYSYQPSQLQPSDFGLPIFPTAPLQQHAAVAYTNPSVQHIHQGQSSYMHSHPLNQVQHVHQAQAYRQNNRYQGINAGGVQGQLLRFAN